LQVHAGSCRTMQELAGGSGGKLGERVPAMFSPPQKS